MTRGLVGAAPLRCLVLPWAGELRPPVGCVMLVCAGGLGQRGAPAWRRPVRSGWGAPFGALALWLIPLGRRCHSPLSSRPLRCGQLRQAACPLRAGVDTSRAAGCSSAVRWVELPPVGGSCPPCPSSAGISNAALLRRSAAATPTVGGRSVWEVARSRQRTHILLGARLSTKRSAMMDVRRRAQEYGGEKGSGARRLLP